MKCGGRKGEPVDQNDLHDLIQEIRNDQIEREKHVQKYTVIDLFRTPKLRKRSVILAFNW